jgi:hypothetical protein
LSFERSLVRIADHLGWPAMGEAIGKAARTVMDYSDHDTQTGICLEDAFTLERAYREAGGEGLPISDCWRLRLEITRTGTTNRDQLVQAIMNANKEGGEATAALVALLRDGADSVDARAARREVEEHVEALTITLALLDDGTGPGVGDGRVTPGGAS